MTQDPRVERLALAFVAEGMSASDAARVAVRALALMDDNTCARCDAVLDDAGACPFCGGPGAVL